MRIVGFGTLAASWGTWTPMWLLALSLRVPEDAPACVLLASDLDAELLRDEGQFHGGVPDASAHGHTSAARMARLRVIEQNHRIS